jgi:hypothetical protein
MLSAPLFITEKGFFEGQMSKNTSQVEPFCCLLEEVYFVYEKMKNPGSYCFSFKNFLSSKL